MPQDYQTVPICKWHETHNEECQWCQRFDRAIRAELAKYDNPPHLHIAVVKLRLEAWIQEVFPPCDDC